MNSMIPPAQVIIIIFMLSIITIIIVIMVVLFVSFLCNLLYQYIYIYSLTVFIFQTDCINTPILLSQSFKCSQYTYIYWYTETLIRKFWNDEFWLFSLFSCLCNSFYVYLYILFLSRFLVPFNCPLEKKLVKQEK